ncbi:MAG: tRNA (pseudouridine(54)-N(1))-methyltransferase TrmY [Thermoplasmata archaeon]
MRRFVLLVHRVPRDGAFTLNDLAGGAGRMDEVARVVSTALTVSNDLRRDTEVVLLLGGDAGAVLQGRRIVVRGDRVRYLNPDERSTAALLKNALVAAVGHPRDFEAHRGIVVGPADPLEELARYAATDKAVWLTEDGPRAPDGLPLPPPETFLLSDPYDPTPAEQEVLRASGVRSLALGSRSLRASQVVDVVQFLVDRCAERAPAVTGPEGPPGVP